MKPSAFVKGYNLLAARMRILASLSVSRMEKKVKVLFLSRIIPRRKKIIAATMFLHSNFTVYLVEEELELLIG